MAVPHFGLGLGFGVPVYFEFSYHLLEVHGQVGEFVDGFGGLFGSGGGALGDGGDLFDIGTNFFCGAALGRGGCGDGGDHGSGGFGGLDDFAQGGAGAGGGFDAEFDLLGAGLHDLHGGLRFGLDALNHLSNFFGSATGALGEFADFVGYNRKATALLTGAGGFDGGVEGEKVGLVGNIIDGADDFANLVAVF